MIPGMKALESGRAQLFAAEQRLHAAAAAYLRRRCGTEIVLAEPLSVDEVLCLELTRMALRGDLERVDQIIDAIGDAIRAKLRPHYPSWPLVRRGARMVFAEPAAAQRRSRTKLRRRCVDAATAVSLGRSTGRRCAHAAWT
jgi:hypothetical protein